nr:T9SS type A sorting domain-containing protein [Edaphocola aurantiacus]
MIQGISDQTTVTVSDVSGRKVLETTGNGPQMTLSLETLTPAVYFITVYTGTTPVAQIKVVKQ